MRYFTYVEPDENDEIVHCFMSYDKIIEEYYPFWSGKMKEVGKEELISKDRCVEDFCIVHWATEI